MPRIGSGIPLVARDAELRTLTDLLDRVRAGDASAVLVGGEAGVGKSRLLAELSARAESDGIEVLAGGCVDAAEASLPYLPFAEMVGNLAATHPDVVDAHPALARLLPGAPLPATLSPGDRDLGQRQMFEGLYDALAEVARDQPVLLTLEDLHWADRSSLDLLTFLLSDRPRGSLAAGGGPARIGLVATFRSDELHRRHPLRPVLAELLRFPDVERLDLRPFDQATALAFVRALCGDDATIRSEQELRVLAARSEGNAFLAEELVSAGDDGLPVSVADVLLTRVERLSPSAQQLVRLASVSGRRVRHDRLRAATELSDDELDAALREAAAQHVLVPDGDGYVFRHALLREAVYADLMPGERTRWHAAYATTLRGDTSPGAAAELAYHAAASHDDQTALAAYVRAAREAGRLGAPAEALHNAEHALQLWPTVADAETVAGISEIVLYRATALYADNAGEIDRALKHSGAALRLASESGDTLVAAGTRRARAEYLLRLTFGVEEAVRLAREADELVAGLPPSVEKAWVQAVHARALLSMDHFEAAREHASRAIATYQELAAGTGTDAGGVDVDAMITMARAEDHIGWFDEARQGLEAAVTKAAGRGVPSVELRARFSFGVVLYEHGELAAAVDTFVRGERLAADNGLAWSGGYGLETKIMRMIAQFQTGEWDAIDAAVDLPGRTVPASVLSRIVAADLPVAVARGRFAEAERRLAELCDPWPSDDQDVRLVTTAGCELEVYRGRPERAAEWIETGLAWMQKLDPFHLVEVRFGALGVMAYVGVAERARQRGDTVGADAAVAAGEKLREAGETATEHARKTMGPEGRAWYARLSAETSRLRGAHDPDLWRPVVAEFGYGDVFRQAEARWRLAEALVVAG
ncbi:MAG: AAA family ATPase, partial [Acidothermales bacterium]|nr:AAA family ATPase [Acidothermales bacterium]